MIVIEKIIKSKFEAWDDIAHDVYALLLLDNKNKTDKTKLNFHELKTELFNVANYLIANKSNRLCSFSFKNTTIFFRNRNKRSSIKNPTSYRVVKNVEIINDITKKYDTYRKTST